MDDFLSKPVDMETFEQTLALWTNSQRSKSPEAKKTAAAAHTRREESGSAGDRDPGFPVNDRTLKELFGEDEETF